MKIARKSFGEAYVCKYEWPEDCFVQCGDNGIVCGKESYTTAFFEAFPESPKTFLRGEGAFVEETKNITDGVDAKLY